MSAVRQFHIFHGRNDFSSDQVTLISDVVRKRRKILKSALDNLRQAVNYGEPQTVLVTKPSGKIKNKTVSKQLSKSPDSSAAPKKLLRKKAMKGRVSYKVKGPDGRLMNIAEIKGWINSIYDGKQGIIKQ